MMLYMKQERESKQQYEMNKHKDDAAFWKTWIWYIIEDLPVEKVS